MTNRQVPLVAGHSIAPVVLRMGRQSGRRLRRFGQKGVGMLCLLQSAPQETTGTDQLSLAAEGEASQGEVTFGQALQALSVRH